MRKVLFLLLCLGLAAGLSAQVIPAMATSGHDLGVGGGATNPANNVNRICVFCHTPHQETITVDPLWNHTLSAVATYGTYDSATFDAGTGGAGLNTIADIGGGTSVSNLCMSCHDGTVGIGSLYNDPNLAPGGATVPSNAATPLAGTALLGTDLTDDHPVNFTYDAALAAADTELTVPASASWVDAGSQIPLFAGTVQCASCHDPHDVTYYPFLLVDNTDSGLCGECHTK